MLFDSLVVGHLEWIARLAFRFCPRKADADDLAQETLCRIFANRSKFDTARDFKPWALTIMSNIYKSQLSRRGRIAFTGLESALELASPIGADDDAQYHDAIDAVRRSASKSVGVECVMLYAQGYSYDEIADIVGIKPGTVKSRIAAGRRLIRHSLDDAP